MLLPPSCACRRIDVLRRLLKRRLFLETNISHISSAYSTDAAEAQVEKSRSLILKLKCCHPPYLSYSIASSLIILTSHIFDMKDERVISSNKNSNSTRVNNMPFT